MKYLAHKDKTREQTNLEHLQGVAEIAEARAVPFMKEAAHAVGYAHDIGKYAELFQDRIRKKTSLPYEHSLGGALEYQVLMKKSPILGIMFMYCIAGHHTGLPDGGRPEDLPDETTLCARLNRKKEFTDKKDYQAYRNELKIEEPSAKELLHFLILTYQKSKAEFGEQFAFFTRYLFSCLVDADYLDTERFYRNPDRTLKSNFEDAESCLKKKLNGFKNTTALQKARGRLQAQAFKNAVLYSGINSLQMPVGSGKTLCSFEIALQKALSSGKKRIIYVIPYTSIIEQTANLLTDLVGQTTDVLQHHSNYSFEDTKGIDSEVMKKLQLASENWDAPIIVTTNVQFFESIYHYKSSKLRKLHNMADSVIVFDEIHMLPVNMLQPCFRAMKYLVEYLNSEVLLLSATMPDYSIITEKLFPDIEIHSLITDTEDFRYFKKCKYFDLGVPSQEELIAKASEFQSSLIIVNKRNTAKRLYENIKGNKYHLSTYMTPFDRSATIQKIRDDLEAKIPVTVVSTSLIEAGVDLDFKAVFREMTGLDSILQSAGRCNREGKDAFGHVFLFRTGERQSSEIQVRSEITNLLLKQYDDIESLECIKDYYRRLFQLNSDDIVEYNIASMPETNFGKNFISIPFTSYAQQFQMIQDNTTGVIIDLYPETSELIAKCKNGDFSARRKLQQYTIALREKELHENVSQGIIRSDNELYILDNPLHYNHGTGLNTT